MPGGRECRGAGEAKSRTFPHWGREERPGEEGRGANAAPGGRGEETPGSGGAARAGRGLSHPGGRSRPRRPPRPGWLTRRAGWRRRSRPGCGGAAPSSASPRCSSPRPAPSLPAPPPPRPRLTPPPAPSPRAPPRRALAGPPLRGAARAPPRSPWLCATAGLRLGREELELELELRLGWGRSGGGGPGAERGAAPALPRARLRAGAAGAVPVPGGRGRGGRGGGRGEEEEAPGRAGLRLPPLAGVSPDCRRDRREHSGSLLGESWAAQLLSRFGKVKPAGRCCR